MGCVFWNSTFWNLYNVKKVGDSMKIFESKKGELSTQQIILLIILIASFLIILFFLFRLNLGSESDKEICHNSVVMRGSSVVPSESVPLKCSRSYICITKDGTCEGMTEPEIKKVKTETEVYSALTNQMAECWWMFGEGKLDYVGKDFFTKSNYCSICSQVLFDDSLKEIEEFENGQISKDKLYNFLTIANYSESKTYSQYFFGTNDLNKLRQAVSENQSAPVTFGSINIGKNQYYVVMGITSEVSGRGWKIAAAAVTTAVGIFIPGLGWTWAGAIVGAVVIGAGEYGTGVNPEVVAIPVEGDGAKNTFMAPTLVEINSEQFKLLNCYDVNTLS